MNQTIKEKIDIAVDCYTRGETMVENGSIWDVLTLQGDDPPPGGVLYRGEEIVAEIAFLLFGGGNNRERVISPRIYRSALRLFKIIHINAEPSYRIRPLEEEGGVVRFTRGKKKRRDKTPPPFDYTRFC